MDMIYVAYGSNMNKGQMAQRCPNAEAIGVMLLPDWRLVFRGVADIVPAKGFQCPVALWKSTEGCEDSLDKYEGFPTLYGKQYWKSSDGNCYMAYTMNRDGLALPPKMYLDGIVDGYEDFGVDKKYLKEALDFTREYDSNDGHIPKRYRA